MASKRAVVTYDVQRSSYTVRIFGVVGRGPDNLLLIKSAKNARGVQFLLRAQRVDGRVIEIVHDRTLATVDIDELSA